MNTSERVRQFLEKQGITKSEFYLKTGLSNGFLDKVANIGSDKIERILTVYPELNLYWLIMGEGEMLNTQVNTQLNTQLLKNGKSASKATSPTIVDRNGIVQIPVTEISVAAGSGHLNPDFVENVDYISLPKALTTRGVHLCVRNKGESMAPTILDSSYVIIRLLERFEWADMDDEYVYVVTDTEGHSYLKRVKNRFNQGFIVLMSDNPDKANYSNFNLQEHEVHNIWVAEFVISAKMPNVHRTYYGRLQELEDRFEDLVNNLQKANPEIKRLQ